MFVIVNTWSVMEDLDSYSTKTDFFSYTCPTSVCTFQTVSTKSHLVNAVQTDVLQVFHDELQHSDVSSLGSTVQHTETILTHTDSDIPVRQ